jgi:hypothetical protein
MERTVQDLQSWSNKMIGKVFYRKDPKNENLYQTVRISFNPFANKMVPQFSNFVEGTPPDTLTPLPPNLLGTLMRFQANTQGFY